MLIVDVEPLAVNYFWTPADLHLHSTFALDGRFTPAELATRLANRGYAIGYITDEPAGQYITTQPLAPLMSGTGRRGAWPIPAMGTNIWLTDIFGSNRAQYLPWLATWETYRDTVRAASTAQVAMFPGLEVAASTVNQSHTEHNGHALAYGIRDLVGWGSFDTAGLRYNWFLPDNLLSNINANRLGWSSATIAHPTGHFEWDAWSVPGSPGGVINARYDGFELMSGVQTSFCPSSAHVGRWRQEIVARLSNAFAGQGFPSARTGSDWGGAGSEFFGISYFTFIGLPSWTSDMRHLLQDTVSVSLRAGRTVASRLGGFATLRLRNAQGVLQEIGSQFTMSANATVIGEIVLRAARAGSSTVRIIENYVGNTGQNSVPAFQGSTVTTRGLVAGQTVIIPVSFRFDGGQRAYHVVVEHVGGEAELADTIYTSPIFIRQQQRSNISCRLFLPQGVGRWCNSSPSAYPCLYTE